MKEKDSNETYIQTKKKKEREKRIRNDKQAVINAFYIITQYFSSQFLQSQMTPEILKIIPLYYEVNNVYKYKYLYDMIVHKLGEISN